MPLDGSTSVPFPKVKPESDQAPRYNYQFTENTNKEMEHVNCTTGMQSQNSSLWETEGKMSHFLPTNKLQAGKKYRWRGQVIIQRPQMPII